MVAVQGGLLVDHTRGGAVHVHEDGAVLAVFAIGQMTQVGVVRLALRDHIIDARSGDVDPTHDIVALFFERVEIDLGDAVLARGILHGHLGDAVVVVIGLLVADLRLDEQAARHEKQRHAHRNQDVGEHVAAALAGTSGLTAPRRAIRGRSGSVRLRTMHRSRALDGTRTLDGTHGLDRTLPAGGLCTARRTRVRRRGNGPRAHRSRRLNPTGAGRGLAFRFEVLSPFARHTPLRLRHLTLELSDGLAILGHGGAEDLRGVNGRVLGAVDGNAGHGHAGGHLHHGEQGVQAAQIAGLNGNANDRQRGEGRHNTTEVRSLASSGNDHPDTAIGRGLGPLMNLRGVAMRTGNDQLIRNPEALQLCRATLHYGQIGLRPHDDADQRRLCGGVFSHTSSHGA